VFRCHVSHRERFVERRGKAAAGHLAHRGATGKDRRVSFVEDRATWIDFSPGAMQRTGNPLDVAIDGKGYFVVQTPRGQRYTRNGALSINAAGALVTSTGD